MSFGIRLLTGLLFVTLTAVSVNASDPAPGSLPPAGPNGSNPSTSASSSSSSSSSSNSGNSQDNSKQKPKKRCHQSCFERGKSCLNRIFRIGRKKEKDDKVNPTDLESGLAKPSLKDDDEKKKQRRKQVASNLAALATRSTYSSASTARSSSVTKSSSVPVSSSIASYSTAKSASVPNTLTSSNSASKYDAKYKPFGTTQNESMAFSLRSIQGDQGYQHDGMDQKHVGVAGVQQFHPYIDSFDRNIVPTTLTGSTSTADTSSTSTGASSRSSSQLNSDCNTPNTTMPLASSTINALVQAPINANTQAGATQGSIQVPEAYIANFRLSWKPSQEFLLAQHNVMVFLDQSKLGEDLSQEALDDAESSDNSVEADFLRNRIQQGKARFENNNKANFEVYSAAALAENEKIVSAATEQYMSELRSGRLRVLPTHIPPLAPFAPPAPVQIQAGYGALVEDSRTRWCQNSIPSKQENLEGYRRRLAAWQSFEVEIARTENRELRQSKTEQLQKNVAYFQKRIQKTEDTIQRLETQAAITQGNVSAPTAVRAPTPTENIGRPALPGHAPPPRPTSSTQMQTQAHPEFEVFARNFRWTVDPSIAVKQAELAKLHSNFGTFKTKTDRELAAITIEAQRLSKENTLKQAVAHFEKRNQELGTEIQRLVEQDKSLYDSRLREEFEKSAREQVNSGVSSTSSNVNTALLSTGSTSQTPATPQTLRPTLPPPNAPPRAPTLQRQSQPQTQQPVVDFVTFFTEFKRNRTPNPRIAAIEKEKTAESTRIQGVLEDLGEQIRAQSQLGTNKSWLSVLTRKDPASEQTSKVQKLFGQQQDESGKSRQKINELNAESAKLKQEDEEAIRTAAERAFQMQQSSANRDRKPPPPFRPHNEIRPGGSGQQPPAVVVQPSGTSQPPTLQSATSAADQSLALTAIQKALEQHSQEVMAAGQRWDTVRAEFDARIVEAAKKGDESEVTRLKVQLGVAVDAFREESLALRQRNPLLPENKK